LTQHFIQLHPQIQVGQRSPYKFKDSQPSLHASHNATNKQQGHTKLQAKNPNYNRLAAK